METAVETSTFVKTSLINGQPQPLLIEPGTSDHSLAGLAQWLNANQATVKSWMQKHGAVLLRGFDINSAQDFEDTAKLINPNLESDYLGTSPRNAITKHVHSASELPDYYPIMQHCEMSFLHNPPSNLFFYCYTAPGKDGETPIVDFRKVYAQLDPKVREAFVTKGVRTIRNYNGPEKKDGMDMWKLKRWDEMFLTTDKAKVEATCNEHLIQYQWLDNGKLRLLNDQDATIKHPETGEPVWFNHTQVFHVASAAIEYGYIVKRLGTLRAMFYNMVTKSMTVLKKLTTKPEEQAMHCTFSDGTPIPDSYVENLEKVIWDNMCFFPWRKGDLLAIDNYSTSHGRMPYEGPRDIYVCWSSSTLPAGYHHGASR